MKRWEDMSLEELDKEFGWAEDELEKAKRRRKLYKKEFEGADFDVNTLSKALKIMDGIIERKKEVTDEQSSIDRQTS